jgi:hypothetical protein
MKAGSPVESMYRAPASTAASAAAPPQRANGPTVDTRTSPRSTSARTDAGSPTSATAVSSGEAASSSPASASSFSCERAASTGRAPRPTRASLTSLPV